MNSARNRIATTLGAAVGAAALAVAGWAPSARAAGAWDAHVRQIFEDHCVKCHGGAKQKAGLDLRSEESVFKGSENGTVVEPGDRADGKPMSYWRYGPSHTCQSLNP